MHGHGHGAAPPRGRIRWASGRAGDDPNEKSNPKLSLKSMGNQSDTRNNWRNSYYELIQMLALKTEDHDKRKHPRVLVPLEIDLNIEIGDESFRVLDISPGGISLVSNNPLAGRSEINIIYDKLFKISSEIIYSRVDPTEDFGEGEHYRIGARFLKEDEGFRIMVMVLQYYGSKLFKISGG